MYIEDYELEVFTPPCEPGAERFSAIAHLKVNLGDVLPYLNAELKGAVYNPGATALTWKVGGHKVTFQQDQIAVADLEDRTEAEHLALEMIDLVNDVWERRDQIEPNHKVRQRPVPMTLYKYLPKTNCKDCGQATCFNFALQLITNQAKLEQCPHIFKPEYSEQLAALQEILADIPIV